MNATPRPWKLHNNHRDYKIYRENGHTIIYHSKRGEAAITPSYDDATLIVRAVNSFDAMREALEQAIARIEVANREGNPIMSAWLPDARAALALAKGEQ